MEEKDMIHDLMEELHLMTDTYLKSDEAGQIIVLQELSNYVTLLREVFGDC